MKTLRKLRKLYDVNLFIFSIEEKLDIELRPDASYGLWVMFLLPIALIISAVKHYEVLSSTYRLLPIFSFGLILTSFCIIRGLRRENYIKVYELWFFIPISILFYLVHDSGFIFSIYAGLMCTYVYSQLYLFILQLFPLSFTLGEGALATQACTILALTIPHFIYYIDKPVVKIGQTSTIIILMELLGVLFVTGFLKFFEIRNNASIYFWTVVILSIIFLIPLHYIMKRSPVVWVLMLLVEDIFTIKMIAYWIVCSCLAAFVAITKSDQATTSERKIFHILAVAVFIPGLIYKCNLLYLGSGILLGIFFLLEIMRNLRVPPLGALLQASFMALKDHKDAGALATTPIYLLTGFTLPLWIHPAPCDVTDSTFFNFLPLMSGILSVGIGDTMASVYGSRYGKIFYPDSKKTFDGTLASILLQLLTILILFKLGFLDYMNALLSIRLTVTIIITALVEALTDQIDNAVLPLIMYIMLI